MNDVGGLRTRRLTAQKGVKKALRRMARTQELIRRAELDLFAALREREEVAEAIQVAGRTAAGEDAR